MNILLSLIILIELTNNQNNIQLYIIYYIICKYYNILLLLFIMWPRLKKKNFIIMINLCQKLIKLIKSTSNYLKL